MAEATKAAKAEAPAEKALSRNAAFSTYRAAKPDELDNADDKVPPGPHVIQERGEASE